MEEANKSHGAKPYIPAEILAPAGNFECFKAALNAGADAVYLGGNLFGARAFAGNFDEEELIRAIHLAHLYGKKVYLTVNTLLRNEELGRLPGYIRPYYEEGLDAAIVQDFGVFAVLREEFPELALHASTQMTITGRYGAKLLKDMGASRVVTARELSLKELKDIHDHVEIELESFVHGALCYSYSGQCLLSSMIGGRSGNRGRCAQPCRLLYSCNGKKGSLLSPKDMCTVELLPDILEAGVSSLKIEGRMKGPEYVAGTVSVYRKYLDRYLKKGRDGYEVDKADIQALMDLFNRGGFCKGYYYRQNDKNMMAFGSPGDKKGERRTRNEELFGKLRRCYIDHEEKLPVRMKITLHTGRRAELTAARKEKAAGEAAGKFPEQKGPQPAQVFGDVLESSLNHPASAAEVKRQLLKLGNTVFSCAEEDITVELSGSPFVPVKLINELRRAAMKELERGITAYGKRIYPKKPQMENISLGGKPQKEEKEGAAFAAAAQVMKKEQLEVILRSYGKSLSRIYISTELEGVDGAVSMCGMVRRASLEAFLVLPYIFRERARRIFVEKLDLIKKAGFDGVVVRSPEEIGFLKENGLDKEYMDKILADYNMYTCNSAAFGEYRRLGISGFALSEELNAGQLRDLIKSVSEKGVYLEKVVYGHLPLMVTAGCTLSYTSEKKPCGKSGAYYITDRMKKRMPLINSCHYCYNLIYNCTPEYLLDRMDEIKAMGAGGARLMFTVETPEQTGRVMGQWLLQKEKSGGGEQNNADGSSIPFDYTRGHYNRGAE